MNLHAIKRKLEIKIQQGQEKQALQNVILQQLEENYDIKNFKDGEKLLKSKINKRKELEELFQKKEDKLEQELNESGILED